MSSPPPSPTVCQRRMAFAVLALGIGLRLHGLGVHSFWYDEAAAIDVAAGPDVFAALRGDRHPPLFFLLLRGWQSLVGHGDAALRVLPAVFGCLSLLGVHVLARRVLAPAAALSATVLFAVAPFQVWYSQELRMYSLLELGAVLALLGATDRGGPLRSAALLFAGSALALGSHYFGFLVPALVAPFVVDGASGRSWRVRASLLAATAAGAAVWVPWIVSVVPDQLRSPWGFQARLGWRELAELPLRMFVVAGSALPTWLVVAIAVGVVTGGAEALALAWRGDRIVRQLFASLLAAAGLLALAFVVLPPNLQSMYLIGVSPVVVLVVAHGLDGALAGLRLRAVAWLLFGCCGLATGLLRGGNHKEDYRGTVAELAASFAPGDLVVAVTGTPERFSQAGLRHYLRVLPDVSAAIEELPGLLARLEAGELPGARVQVLLRDRPYAAPWLQRVAARAQLSHRGEQRELLQHLTFTTAR